MDPRAARGLRIPDATAREGAAVDALLANWKGAESAGVPEAVHNCADARLRVPLRPHCRSLNVALTAAMAIGEALRQTATF